MLVRTLHLVSRQQFDREPFATLVVVRVKPRQIIGCRPITGPLTKTNGGS